MRPTFDDFWSCYPRKVAKGKARRAWDKQVKAGFSPETIMDGLQRLHGYLLALEPQFRPHPATWLNDERWTDEPAPPMVPLPGQGTGAYGRRTNTDVLRDMIARLNQEDSGDQALDAPFLDLKALN